MVNYSDGTLTIRDADAILSSMEPLGPPVRPWRGWRNTDKQGSGVWFASRDGGARHHLGNDAISVPGDDALAMLSGTVKRLMLAYPGTNLRGAVIYGSGKWEGLFTIQLYFEPLVSAGQTVHLGQVIGSCQDVAAYYAGMGKEGMTNHLHCEGWQARNMQDLMARMPVPSVDA